MFYRYEHYMSISHMALIVAIVYEFNPTSPAVFRMSGSSNLDSFCDM